MRTAESFFNWAFKTRANTVARLCNHEEMSPEKVFLSFCSHDPAFISHGPEGLNASIKGIGFMPKREYLEETLEARKKLLAEKALEAVGETGMDKLVLAGGVAANSSLEERLRTACEEKGIRFYFPNKALCTDNAAMIGIVGYYKYQDQVFCPIDAPAFSKVTFK